MAALRITLCAIVMVTVALSKPVCVGDCEDSSKSSESIEANSSEETATHVEPSQEPLQPAFTETAMPNAIEETNSTDAAALLPSADTGLSPAPPDTSALPNPEDPQTSTDTEASQLMPDDPSQTALSVDYPQDMPDSDPAQDSRNADNVQGLPDTEVSRHTGLTDTVIAVGGTNQPQVTTTTTTTTTTYQRSPKGATPPFPPHIIKPTPPPFHRAPALPIPIGTALTGVPVCFTFQFATTEPEPPRGDSI